MNDAGPVLAVTGLGFSRSGRPVLRELDLALDAGRITLLTGHNGSGKSTLLRILAGLLPPDRGRWHIDGTPGSSWQEVRRSLLQRHCYLHQQPYLFDATVFDNIAYGLRRRRVPRREIAERVAQALRHVSLEPLRDRPARALSGGEQQRVAIARAWVLRPRLMLLDEPVANMDKPARRRSIDLINRLAEHGIAVVVTSHDPQHGELRIRRHLHLYQGELSERRLRTEAASASH